MGFTMIVALILFILFIVVIVTGKWKLFILSIVCLSIIIVSIVKGPVLFQKSTELENEGFNQVRIGNLVDKDETSQVVDNVFYRSWKKNPSILIRVNKGVIKELTLNIEPTNTSISTMKGITMKSTFSEVVHNYGESYRKLRFVEMYGVGIEYRDKKNGILLQFFFDNEELDSQVRHIEVIKI